MYDYIISSSIMLFVVLDPIGVAPLFIALTQGSGERERRHIAIKGVSVAAIILLLFALGGHLLLSAMGISLDAFRIGGGILLFLLAMDMLFARQSGLRSTTKREQEEAVHRQDISVFPLAIPLLAGPGAMTTVLILVGEAKGEPMMQLTLLTVALVMLLITILVLLMSSLLMRVLGETGTNVISRVFGVVLAALAVQYIIDGLHHAFPLTS